MKGRVSRLYADQERAILTEFTDCLSVMGQMARQRADYLRMMVIANHNMPQLTGSLTHTQQLQQGKEGKEGKEGEGGEGDRQGGREVEAAHDTAEGDAESIEAE